MAATIIEVFVLSASPKSKSLTTTLDEENQFLHKSSLCVSGLPAGQTEISLCTE